MRKFGIENPRRLAQLMLWTALVMTATYVSLGTLRTEEGGGWCYHMQHLMVCNQRASTDYTLGE